MSYLNNIDLITNEIKDALNKVNEDEVNRLIEDILSADKVFMTGVGRVLMSLQAFTKRLTHLGIEAHCVGDITEPALTSNSLLIVGSGSGCSIVPVAIAKKAKELGAKVIHIGSNVNSDVKQYCDYMVRIPVQTRLYLQDEIKSKQPMTSLFEQCLLIFGDAVSIEIIDRKQLNLELLWNYHANLEWQANCFSKVVVISRPTTKDK